jgi:hypothetical protein
MSPGQIGRITQGSRSLQWCQVFACISSSRLLLKITYISSVFLEYEHLVSLAAIHKAKSFNSDWVSTFMQTHGRSIMRHSFFVSPIKHLRALYIPPPDTGTLGLVAQHLIKCQTTILYQIQNVSVPYFPPWTLQLTCSRLDTSWRWVDMHPVWQRLKAPIRQNYTAWK